MAAAVRAADPKRTLLVPAGGHFVGDFNADFRPHGEGTQYRADGSEAASGQWRDGNQHGHGKQILLNGDCYEGDFVDGTRSGLGTYTWAEASMFEGEWVDNECSGFGVMWDKHGTLLYCGRWGADKLVETGPVPRSKIPIGSFLSAAGTRCAAWLLLACRQQQSAAPQR